MGQPTELTEGDAAVVAHLKARGATVTVLGTADGNARTDPAQVTASHELLLISSTIQSLDTAARYAQTATPLIFWEPLRLLEATQLARWGGTRDRTQTYIRIVDAGHPITAGLPVEERLLCGAPARYVQYRLATKRARGTSTGDASVWW